MSSIVAAIVVYTSMVAKKVAAGDCEPPLLRFVESDRRSMIAHLSLLHTDRCVMSNPPSTGQARACVVSSLDIQYAEDSVFQCGDTEVPHQRRLVAPG
jgi:hypothetical protein